jgi:hypothetical protein
LIVSLFYINKIITYIKKEAIPKDSMLATPKGNFVNSPAFIETVYKACVWGKDWHTT